MTQESSRKVVFAVFVFGLFAALALFLFLNSRDTRMAQGTRDAKRATDVTSARQQSLMQQNPKILQDKFSEDLRNGINDKHTKSSAYFITHRYFDNGGNAYELYDYIQSHPELAFLNEAETIHPNAFKFLKDRTLPTTHTDRGMYIYLAYLEALDKHGYADVALYSTGANQYAKMVFLRTYIAKETAGTPSELKYTWGRSDIGKAIMFGEKAKPFVGDILAKKLTSADVPSHDILVGLNQYASALRYAEALGYDVSFEPKNSREIFTFAMDYAHQFVPDLYLFTAFLNASTLNIIKSTDAEIQTAIYPIIDFDTAHNPPQSKDSIIMKIISMRYEKAIDVPNMSLDLYGKPNIVSLAKRVPGFKKWLISNGWEDADFDYSSGPYGPR